MLKDWFRSPRRHLPGLGLVCFGIFASALCFIAIRSLEVDKAQAVFRRVSQERLDDLQSDLDLTVSKVVALGAYCQAGYPITRASFDAFVTPLRLSQDAGIQALEWAPQVSRTERAAVERAARQSGLAGFEIRDRQAQGKMVRSAARPSYFPVLYVQPCAGNEAALGYDLLSSSGNRREALMRAAATGELTATHRITLVQETSHQSGILIVRPVYRHSDPVNRNQLLGFALGVLRVGNVVEKHGAGSGVDLAIMDITAPRDAQQLYPAVGMQPQPDSSYTQYRMIAVGGRIWRIAASPKPGTFPVSNTYSYVGSALCLLFTLMLAGFVRDTLNRHWEIERLVKDRTSELNSALAALAEVHRDLEDSEARYRRLVEDSPGAIVVERAGKIVLANRTALEMFGFDPGHQIEGRGLLEFVIPERRELSAQLHRELRARPMHISPRESQMLRRDGKVIDVEFAASSFLQEGIPTIQLVLRDISQRKHDEAVTARMISAIEQVCESIVITDPDANIVYVNPAFERITGYSREEALGKTPNVLKSGRQSAEFYAQLWATLKSGQAWSGRFLNRAKNGRLFTEEATISPVVDRSGQIINYVAVKRDVTLETELQEQLHQSQKMDAVGRLAGGVAHDFNNMLMVIVSYAELAANSLSEDDPMSGHLTQILRAAHRSSALTRQLLAFSRKQILAPQVLDCNTLVTETSSMVRRLISENIDLRCHLAPDLWPVKADADQIVQVILNLCVNSRDAMPNGGSLVLSTRNYQVDEGFVELSVSDTGIGIPLDIQEKLFEPFFTTKERGKGTGLGLATVYGIVQQSGGAIRVESAPGKGSTFIVHLPRCTQAAPAPELPALKPFLAVRSRILVVEDEDALREAITDQLRNHGYQVLAAADGIEALEILAHNSDLSILICDLIMPRMGGRELARRAVKKFPHLSFIFMSGHADNVIGVDDSDETPSAFLQKPFAIGALLNRITELTSHRGLTPVLPVITTDGTRIQ